MFFKRKYHEDIDCVLEPSHDKGGLYISNIEAARNTNKLKKLGIQSILTASQGTYLDHPKEIIPFYYYVPGRDHESYNINVYFDNAADFINFSLKHTNVLVHCMAGISRSVTLVIAFMIKYQKITYEQAFIALKKKRPIVQPNKGFIQQLKQFEKLHIKPLTFSHNLTPKDSKKLHQLFISEKAKTIYDNIELKKQNSYILKDSNKRKSCYQFDQMNIIEKIQHQTKIKEICKKYSSKKNKDTYKFEINKLYQSQNQNTKKLIRFN